MLVCCVIFLSLKALVITTSITPSSAHKTTSSDKVTDKFAGDLRQQIQHKRLISVLSLSDNIKGNILKDRKDIFLKLFNKKENIKNKHEIGALSSQPPATKNSFYQIEKPLPEKARRKRDLAGTRTIFDRPGSRKKHYNQDTLKMKPKSSIQECVSYSYSVWVDDFALNGSVSSCYLYEDRLKIVFKYSKNTEGNVSIWVIKPHHQPTSYAAKDPSFIGRQKPGNCHLQNDDKTQPETNKCQNPIDRRDIARSKKFSTNSTKNLSSSVNTDSQPSKGCKRPMTSFSKTWMCFKPTFFPCLIVYIHARGYKITEKVCPLKPALKKQPFGKRHK